MPGRWSRRPSECRRLRDHKPDWAVLKGDQPTPGTFIQVCSAVISVPSTQLARCRHQSFFREADTHAFFLSLCAFVPSLEKKAGTLL